MARRLTRSDNGGPPLDDYDGPPWGKGDPHRFLHWQRGASPGVEGRSRATSRCSGSARPRRSGLTYEEYTLEILERGRYLQAEDEGRVAEIKAKRKRRRVSHLE